MTGRLDPTVAPVDLDAERAVLGAVLLSDAALAAPIEAGVRPEDFYRDDHGLIFRAMLAVHDRGGHVDRITLADELRAAGKLEDVGGLAAIDLLAAASPDTGNVSSHCDIVIRVHRDRQMLRAAYQLATAIPAGDVAARDQALAELADINTVRRLEVKRDQATEFTDWYENQRTGLPLPFSELTQAVGMGGLQAGESTMLGGWPTHGKSILASQILDSGLAAGARVHEYANEMTGPARTARLITTRTGIPTSQIADRKLTTDEWAKVLDVLKKLPYETTSTAGWSVEDYCRDLRRQQWDLAAVDTVTNLPCSRVDEWDRACTMLNDAADQAGTHLVLLCQLNLERDKGTLRPPPTGRDLRNTGAWYQRARVVMFVHRQQELQEGTDIPRVLSDGFVRVDKASHGMPEKGFVNVTLDPRWMRFDRLNDYRAPREEIAA